MESGYKLNLCWASATVLIMTSTQMERNNGRDEENVELCFIEIVLLITDGGEIGCNRAG